MLCKSDKPSIIIIIIITVLWLSSFSHFVDGHAVHEGCEGELGCSDVRGMRDVKLS